MARPPAATISSRVWLSDPWYLGSGSIVRAVSATVAPRAASRAAIALPSPRLLPVTRATFPSHRGSAFIVASSGHPIIARRERSAGRHGLNCASHVVLATPHGAALSLTCWSCPPFQVLPTPPSHKPPSNLPGPPSRRRCLTTACAA